MKTIFGLLLACVVVLVVLLAMLAIEGNPDRAATQRAAAEAQAQQAAAQAAAAQAALERERWAGQAQLEMAQAQASVMRTNAAMPTITLVVAGTLLLALPVALLVVGAVLLRRGRDEMRQALPPVIGMMQADGQVVYLLPPGESTRALMPMDRVRVLRIE